MAFIIGSYNKYDVWDRTHSRYKFEINGTWYAVKEIEMEWGIPKLPQYVDRENDAQRYHVYDTFEEAMGFVHSVRCANTY